MTTRSRSSRKFLGGLVLASFALIALALSSMRSPPADAFSIEFQGRQVQRTILALYDSKTEGPINQTRLHKLAEMPLNHLGFKLDYVDVNTPLPSPQQLASYRAILSWFVEPLVDAPAYVDWLDRATSRGIRYVMLGEIAPRETDEMLPAINRILERLGLQSGQYFIELTHKAKIAYVNDAMIGFERKLDKVLPGFPVIELKSRSAKAHLTVEAATSSGTIRSTPVSTSEAGGYAAQNYTVILEPNTDRLGWILNPFVFFRLALGDERFPIPDVTTVSGRRIYFSHIDGDGWNNMSELEGYRENQTLSAEVIAKEAIEPFPDLPVSVGLIAADVQPLLGGNANGIKVARQLYALKQVEVASHTHTHPYNWYFFERYSRPSEEAKMKAYRPPDMPVRERIVRSFMQLAGKTYNNPKYDDGVSGSDELPRTYLRKPFDLDLEVRGALAMSEQFAPPGRKARLYLWSGDTTPYEAAIKATRSAGVRNMNGGDSRLDREYPSVAYVPPIGRQVGAERHIYSVNSNENTYTNDWTGPFGGQMMLEHTLTNTETPVRLKGFNLYYHMYSGEKPAALRAVKYFLDMARTTPVVPIPASEYAAIADSFYDVEVAQVELFSWAVRNRGALNTIRFDDADHLAVDLAASQGVLGSNRTNGSLYIALDPAHALPIVSLRARDAATDTASPREPALSLVDARWQISKLTFEACAQSISAQGFGPGDMTWQTKPNSSFKVRISRDGEALLEDVLRADASGTLKFPANIDARDPVDVSFKCQE